MNNNDIISFDSIGIQEFQRNRYPMLFIDRITECVPLKYAKGVKLFSCQEWYFAGHFPDNPIVPGTVLIESLAQVFLMTFLSVDEYKGSSAVSNRYQNIKFKRKVFPGDKLDITAELKSFRRGVAIGKAEGCVNGEVAISLDCTIVVPSAFSEFRKRNDDLPVYVNFESAPEVGLCYNNNQIKEIMKNRNPWLYLDKAVDIRPMESAVGIKNFTFNEWFFPVHFPEDPNVPGFIQVETCLQAFLLTILTKDEYKGLETADVSVDNVRFLRKVIPGEQFEAKATLQSFSRGLAKGFVESFVNSEQACRLDVIVAIPSVLDQFIPQNNMSK